jgi:FtsP/CotA-like multicopper oxidase with cupredoxin domain
MNRKNCLRYAQALALGLVVLAAATPSLAVELAAVPAEWMPPGGLAGDEIPMWAFVDAGTDASAFTCPAAPVAWGLGPQIDVPAAGTSLTINIKNCLSEPVSMFIPGQAKVTTPVWTDDSTGDRTAASQRVRSFDAEVAAGANGSYTWTGVRSGTFLYQSGSHPQVAVQMGLYGVLTVGSYPYPAEQAVVFSEIDPALHAAVDGGTYGSPSYPSTFDYYPKYFLINGAAYPAGSDLAVVTSESTVFRFVNAGLKNRVPTLQGLYMTLLAEDGFAYPEPMQQYSVLLAPGKTIDAVLNAGSNGKYALYDRSLGLTNAAATGGGMLTYIQAGAGTGTPPTATDDTYAVDEDVTLTADGIAPNPGGVLANDSVDALAAALVSGPSAGVLALAADGTFTYTPNADFNGIDLFTYTANDGAAGPASNLATVRITVNPVNDAPVAAGDGYDAPQGEILTVAAPGVLENDTDVDGDALSVGSVEGLTANVGSSLTLASTASVTVNADGSFAYTPAAGAAVGSTDTFAYEACDAAPLCSAAVVTITITAPPANIAPVAYNVNAQTTRNVAVTFNVTFNDVDPDGNIDIATVDLNPGLAGRQTTVITQQGGSASVDNAGNVTFTPKNGFRGTDLFTYTVNDNDGAASNEATVRINVKK